MLSSMFLVGGINSLKNTDYLAERAKPVMLLIVIANPALASPPWKRL